MEQLRRAMNWLKVSPWWFLPTVLFGATRVIYFLIISATAHLQTVDTSGAYGKPRNVIDYWTVLANWDAGTYYRIAEYGYPNGFVYNGDGSMGFNELAFYPLWPSLLNFVHSLTGLSYPVAASILSLTFGLAAVLMLYRFVQKQSSQTLATVLLLWLCFYPTSVILQTGYSEALCLLLIVITLKLVHSNKLYWTLMPLTLLAFTRPIVLAMGLTFAVYGVYRYVQQRRGGPEYTLDERIGTAFITFYSGLAFGFWPLYVAYVTGDFFGYLKIQSAWRVEGMLTFFNPLAGGGQGLLLLLVYVAIGVAATLTVLPLVKRGWPPIFALWVPVYLVYIYLTSAQGIPFANGKITPGSSLHIGTSTWRYLLLCALPLLPFAAVLQKHPSKTLRLIMFGLMIVLGLVGSYFYITSSLLDRAGFLGAP